MPKSSNKKAGGSGQRGKAKSINATGKSKASKTKIKGSGMTAEQREKYNLVQKLNKRIRDTVNRIGTTNKTVEMWQNKLQLSGFETISAFDKDDTEYLLLSRSASDLSKMSMEDLQRLEKQIPRWEQTKSEIIKQMNDDLPPGQQYTKKNPPSFDEMRQFATMHYEVARMFDNNADLFYMLINNTNWDSIRDHSFEEIYNELQKIDPDNYAWMQGDKIIHKADVGEAYKKRRAASIEAKKLALQNVYQG